jgi:hypothetical protein
MSIIPIDPQSDDQFLDEKARILSDLGVVPKMIEMGRHLFEVKVRVSHGKYRPWLKKIGFSERSALKFVHMFQKWGSNPTRVVDLKRLSIHMLSLLAAPSTPDEATDETLALLAREVPPPLPTKRLRRS